MCVWRVCRASRRLTLRVSNRRPVGGSDGGTPGGQFLFNFKLNAPKLTYVRWPASTQQSLACALCVRACGEYELTRGASGCAYREQDVDLAMLFPGFQCSVININDYISDEALEKMGSDKRKRQKVLFEIINTEKSYACSRHHRRVCRVCARCVSCVWCVSLTCGWWPQVRAGSVHAEPTLRGQAPREGDSHARGDLLDLRQHSHAAGHAPRALQGA